MLHFFTGQSFQETHLRQSLAERFRVRASAAAASDRRSTSHCATSTQDACCRAPTPCHICFRRETQMIDSNALFGITLNLHFKAVRLTVSYFQNTIQKSKQNKKTRSF
jgi:hypothetical protein